MKNEASNGNIQLNRHGLRLNGMIGALHRVSPQTEVTATLSSA